MNVFFHYKFNIFKVKKRKTSKKLNAMEPLNGSFQTLAFKIHGGFEGFHN
jgi:hypothetical protein